MSTFKRSKAIARANEAARQKKFYENKAKQGNARANSKLELYGSPEAIAKRTADAQKQREREFQERQAIAPTYRDSYEVGEPTSFEEAKQAADETYMQYWYDKANEISSKWEDEDYALIAEPKTERYNPRTGQINQGFFARGMSTRRVVPEGYYDYVDAQERIEAGPLDFSSEKTHRMLINPPQTKHGYGKRQYWINEDKPLRQAVEAQADVMKDFLDDAGVPIVQKYEDLEGFKRPDSFRGEGIYLNTGTAAHINWDAGLKRMQRYQTSPDAELGTYSNVFVRPDPEGIAKPLAFVGAITGNPWLTAASSVAAGGDLEDALKGAAKGYAIGQVTAPIFENTIANFGIDKDLFGMDAETFSESAMDVQTTILEGGNVEDALIKEFGVPAIKQLGSALPDVNIDLPESQLLSDIGDALEPVVGAVRAGGRAFDDTVLQPVKRGLEPVVDVAQEGIDVLQEAVQPISDVTSDIEDIAKESGRKFDDTVLQPVKEGVQAVTEPVVDVIDDIIDTVDSPLGDVLQAGGNFLGGLLGGLGSQQPQTVSRTPVEGLFDKELFKFDTEIKSTQEMLSPMMNSRRYG